MNVAHLQRQNVYIFVEKKRKKLTLHNFCALLEDAVAATPAATSAATQDIETHVETHVETNVESKEKNKLNAGVQNYTFVGVVLTSATSSDKSATTKSNISNSNNGGSSSSGRGGGGSKGGRKNSSNNGNSKSNGGNFTKLPEPSTFVASDRFPLACAGTVVGQLYAQVTRRELLDRKRLSEQNLPSSWHAVAHFKHDQMVESVKLSKYRHMQLFQLELSLFPSRAFQSSANQARVSLQHFLAFCLSKSFRVVTAPPSSGATADDNVVVHNALNDKDLDSLNLYSFAWLCSLLQTLKFFRLAERLEGVLVQNLEHFYRKYDGAKERGAKTNNDYCFVIMFLGSLAARRLVPMRQLLQFMQMRHMIDDLRDICARNSGVLALNVAGATMSKSRAAVVQETAQTIMERIDRILNVDRQQTAQLSPTTTTVLAPATPERRESLHKVSREKRAFRLLALVDVFVAWLSRIIVATKVRQGVQCFALFDNCICSIECGQDGGGGAANNTDTDTPLHRRYTVTRVATSQNHHCGANGNSARPRVSQFSVQDLNEWLRYMVLLQLDERNVHLETSFLLCVDSAVLDFGKPPRLVFDGVGGMQYLAYFLLQSEFVRACLYQRRAEVRKTHDAMLADAKLPSCVETREPFANFVVLNEYLLAYATQRFQLRTVQGVSMQPFERTNIV